MKINNNINVKVKQLTSAKDFECTQAQPPNDAHWLGMEAGKVHKHSTYWLTDKKTHTSKTEPNRRRRRGRKKSK